MMEYRIYSRSEKAYVSNTKNFVLDASGKIRALGGLTFNPESGMIAEMCTGYKSETGELVYEGDEVFDGVSQIYIVEYVKSDAAFKLINQSGGEVESFESYSEGCLEIIGNINTGR
jgi:hypothetical protein